MSDPITINIDAGWLNRAWACIPKTRTEWKTFVISTIPRKIGNSIMFAAYHTQVWIAIIVSVIAGAAAGPLIRPHLPSSIMVEAENVGQKVVAVDLRGVQAQLDAIQRDQANAYKLLADTNTRAVATHGAVLSTQGSVAQVVDFTQHVPEMMQGMFAFGAAQTAPAAAPVAKPKPQPIAKKPPAPTHEAPKPAPVPAEPAALSLPDWIKSKF
jgi:hypothetical protein